jgi:hypothetical protein
MSNQRILWGLLIGLAAAILIVVAVKLRPGGGEEPILVGTADADCELRAGPCTARFPGGGEVTLDIAPRDLPLATPLALAVAVRGLTASAAAVDFVGTEMYMGYNRPALTADGAGRFRGGAMLPVCIRRRMAWEARVLLTTPAGLLAAPFRFETRR